MNKYEFRLPPTLSEDHQAVRFQKKASRILHFINISFLGILLSFSLLLLYYSVSHHEHRRPQSVVQVTSDIVHEGNVYYGLAEQAYHNGEYLHAKQYWREAKKLSFPSPSVENLGGAIEEAIVYKTLFTENLRKKNKAYQQKEAVDSLFKVAENHVDHQEWNLATITLQEILLMDPTEERASRGIGNITKLKNISKIPKKATRPESHTLKIFNRVQTLLKNAKALEEDERYMEAMAYYREAITLAKKIDLQISGMVELFLDVQRTLKTKTKDLWGEIQLFVEGDRDKEAIEKLQFLLKMDPGFKPAIQQWHELKESIQRKAQTLYSKSLLFETIPDIDAAKILWNNILSLLKPGEIYFEKAKKKLARYSGI